MRKVHCEIETDGFYGVYWKCKSKETRLDIDRRVRKAIQQWM